MNVPVGRDASGRVLPVSEAYIRAVVEARSADSAVARQLTVLTTRSTAEAADSTNSKAPISA